MDIKSTQPPGLLGYSTARLWAVVLLLLVTVSAAHAGNPLPDYNAVYLVEKLDNIVGKSTYRLKNSDEGIHFSQTTELVGIAALFRDDRIEEDSWLVYDGDLLLLKKYQYLHSGSKKNKNVDLEISWSPDETSQILRGQMTGTSAGRVIREPVDTRVRDALSFQLSLI